MVLLPVATFVRRWTGLVTCLHHRQRSGERSYGACSRSLSTTPRSSERCLLRRLEVRPPDVSAADSHVVDKRFGLAGPRTPLLACQPPHRYRCEGIKLQRLGLRRGRCFCDLKRPQ